MTEPFTWSARSRRPARVVRPLVLTVMVAGLLALLHPVPAEAHIVGAGGTPSNYRAAVTSVRPAAPAVDVTVGLGGQWVSVTNRGAKQIVVLGTQGEPFLRLAGNQVQVNQLSPTTAEAGLVQRGASANDSGTGPRWVTQTDGDHISWSDPRLSAPADADESASWQLPLMVDGQRVSVLGTVDRIPASWPWLWVSALVLLLAAVSALGWVRNWRPMMVTVVVVGILAFVAHLIGTGFAPQQNGAVYAWIGISAVAAFAVLIGVVTLLSTVRGKASAPERVVTTGIMVLVLAATDITVLWSSQLPFAGPAALDRALTVLTYATSLGMLVAGLRLARRERRASAEAVEPGTAGG